MLNKKSNLLIGILIISSLLYIGCQESDVPVTLTQFSEATDIDEDTSASDNDGITFPEKYEKESGNVTFETMIVLNKDFNPNEIYDYIATLQQPDPSNTLKVLFSGINYQEEITTNDSGQTDYYYAGQNGETLLIYPESVQLYKSFADHLPRILSLSYKYNYNGDKYSQSEEFSFAARDTALTDILDILSKMGITIGNDYSYSGYSLDYQTMKNEETVLGIQGEADPSRYKENWSSDDDCYYFALRQTCQKLPVYYIYSDIYKEASDAFAQVQAAYSKDGLFYLLMDKTFKFQKRDTKLKLKNFEEIAGTVEYKYANIISDDNYIVTKAQLMMMARQEKNDNYLLTPVWVFDVTEILKLQSGEGSVEEHSVLNQVIVNAVTGEEIIQ